MRSRALCAGCILVLLGAATIRAAAGAEGGSVSKRLVLCLDGTLNGPEQSVQTIGDHRLYKPTNVLKTFRAVLPVGDDHVNQIAYYSEGVGSFVGEPDFSGRFEEGVDRAFGGVLAVGYEARVKSAYRFLVANYAPDDQIFVFGFSRGAAEVQTLVRFIDWVGGILQKQDEYYLPELYEGFRKSEMKPHSHEAPGKAREVFDKIRNRRGGDANPICDPQPAMIEFLGVYETVVSVGSRLAPDGEVTTVPERYAYLANQTPPKIVKTIRQALSIDERRWDFRPQVWKGPGSPSQSLVQLWFPGVHSNIGGGFRYDGLADTALKWMLDETNKVAHLSLDDNYLKHFTGCKPACYEPSRPDSDTALYRIAEAIRFKSGRGVRKLATWDNDGSWQAAGLGFHESLGQLLIDDCTYRPKNLLEYLAQDPQRITRFPVPETRQAEIRKIVAAFATKTERCQPLPCRVVAPDSCPHLPETCPPRRP